MLTRLKVSGFKNLVDVDVRFGPFTCIAGPNGAGKSNLFDAIQFLSALADGSLYEAATSVRDGDERSGDIRHLFHHIGDSYVDQIAIEAEMIIPPTARDDLGQIAQAGITFLRYSVVLAYRMRDNLQQRGMLELKKEELTHIKLGEAKKALPFPHQLSWRKSALHGRRTSPYISTETHGGELVIQRHQEGVSGRPLRYLAAQLPRTVLSVANASESPTALVARREMQSWRQLLLDPAALRRADLSSAPTKLGIDGAHLAATLYHLAHTTKLNQTAAKPDPQATYGQITVRLASLIDDVRDLWVDYDERRDLLTLQISDHSRTIHPARALSDGTLRFLALAVLEHDPETQGLICLEEPENGIHPERIPALLRLLQGIATDVDEPLGPDNPLRQVIVNTHSPTLVSTMPDDSLLFAELKETTRDGRHFQRAAFSALPETWRQQASASQRVISRWRLLSYLYPVRPEPEPDVPGELSPRRVVDRPDLQPMLPDFDA